MFYKPASKVWAFLLLKANQLLREIPCASPIKYMASNTIRFVVAISATFLMLFLFYNKLQPTTVKLRKNN